MRTPDFPAFQAPFATAARRLRRVADQPLHHFQLLFGPLLPPELLAPAEEGRFSRQRLWPLRLTFLSFLWQVAQVGASCRAAVDEVIALCHLEGRPAPDRESGAYCTARKDLPLAWFDDLHRAVVRGAEALVREADQWCGLRVRVADGTTVTMADTPLNQAAYRQQNVQAPGCGFPIMRVLAFFCLGAGLITHWATGTWYQHELSLLGQLLPHLGPKDVLLGDRGFGNYSVLAQCARRGVHAVFRANTAKRRIDFRGGKRLGPGDRLVTWKRGPKMPTYLDPAEWALWPLTLEVRVVKLSVRLRGMRTRQLILVTNLLDPVRYPAAALGELYLRRWRMELCFRDLKTSLGMEHLDCKSPEMAERALRMHLLLHNLVRRLALDAARRHGVAAERMSFVGTLGKARSCAEMLGRVRGRARRAGLVEKLYREIAGDPVPWRPGRREPRALKRRPKPYPLLTRHRRLYREIPHRNRYQAAANPRK